MMGKPRWILPTAALVAAIAVIFAFDLTPWVRGGFGWRWAYDPLPLTAWIVPAAVVTVYGIGVVILYGRTDSRALIVWSAGGAVVLALAVTATREGDALYGLFARTISKVGTGPFWLSTHVDWTGGGWRDWTAVMQSAGGHLSNLPPGWPMLYALLAGVGDALPAISRPISDALWPYQCQNFDVLAYTPGQVSAALFGMLMPLWAGLAAIPLYRLMRRLSGKRAADLAVALWPLTPALAAFAGSMNTVYPLATLWAVSLLAAAISAKRARYQAAAAIGAGLVTGIALFFNFAFAPLPLILGLFALTFGLHVERRTLAALIRTGLFAAAGFAVPWVLFWIAAGLTPLDLIRASFAFHLDLDRPYAFWVVMHAWDWLVWAGVGLIVPALVSAVRGWRDRSGLGALSAALLIGMLIVTLSGTARGETGRVWLVFTPLLLAAGADGLTRVNPRAEQIAVFGAAHALLMLVLAMSLPVVGLDVTPSPSPDSASAARPADAVFMGADDTPFAHLTGWDAASDGERLSVRLTFDVLARAPEPYWIGAILVPVSGDPVAGEPQQPHNADGVTVPATCWPPGSRVSATITQPVGVASLDGAYLSIALYGAQTGDGPLTVVTGTGAERQVGVGPVR
ncbi:MAG: hypothetical protein UZ13_03878 [Chloroflexi bacterium OLB13]|nr:MAG: hypothetical protein UZ13_03878 [Chloroflexi bacterium OLB13]